MGLLINRLMDYVPFAEKMPTCISSLANIDGNENKSKSKISRKEEENRIRVAKSMQKAIKNKKLSPDLESAVKTMQIKAQENLALKNYEENKYFLDQTNKILFITSFIFSTPFLSTGLLLARAKNAYDYNLATPDTEKGENCLNEFSIELVTNEIKNNIIIYGKNYFYK